MFLAVDSKGLLFTASFSYPNLKCTVNFVCIADGTKSSNIIATSYHLYNSESVLNSNN